MGGWIYSCFNVKKSLETRKIPITVSCFVVVVVLLVLVFPFSDYW